MDHNSTNSQTSVRKDFQPAGLATLIGSLPLKSHEEALNWIFAATPEIPLWPQLPGNPLERMLRQFIEGFPGIIENEDNVIFDTTTALFEEEMLAFFEDFLSVSENPATLIDSRFSMDNKRGAGLFSFKEAAKNQSSLLAAKGQITGPFTMLTGLTDSDKKLAFYDPMMREIIVKGIAARAAWQTMLLKELQCPAIVFLDEPALAGLGSSSFIGVSNEDISQDLSEGISAIQGAGGLAGIHVCANTDWNLLFALDLDILSFDAYGYFDRLVTCREQTLAFIERGGILAWGIVPTGEAEHIEKETAESLASRWEDCALQLGGHDLSIQEIHARALITPSCGTGSLSKELAQKVMDLTKDTSTILRKKFGR